MYLVFVFPKGQYESKYGSCLLKNSTFLNIIPCAKHILNTFKLRMLYAHLYLFHCIHFICSYYLDKHPSLCEQFS